MAAVLTRELPPSLPHHRPSSPEPLLGAPAGALTLLVGDASRGAAERLLLAAAEASRGSLLVCGDNRFDAYGLLALARARGLEDAVADGVLLARAFTVHQFVALLDDALPAMARERSDTGVAVVTGLVDLFLDEDVRDQEARTLLRRALRGLSAWMVDLPFPVVATVDAPASARAGDLLAIASGVAARRVDAPAFALPPVASPQLRLDAFATRAEG